MPLTRRTFVSLAAGLAAKAQSSEDLCWLNLTEAAAKIRSREVTSTRIVEACLARIQSTNPRVNAFITVTGELALAQAKAADASLANGKLLGPLHGIPIALKDNIDTAGVRTTAASALFDDRVPAQDAEVTRRLKSAGAILIGKTNMNEFALGGTSSTSYYGPGRNPWALDRNPGGSSGGSGAAVAAGMCPAALGTDTSGSIRIPASHCGIVGLKPTYGLVSIRGVIPLTYSLDHCGPMTRTVEDAAVLLNVLAGYDKLDIASVQHPAEDYVAGMKQPVSGLRVGLPRIPFFDLVDPEIAKSVEDAIRVLARIVKSVKDVALPSTNNVINGLGGELYAYHEELYKRSPARYQLRARHILRDRAQLKVSDYIRAKWEMELLRRTIDDAFTDFDVVVFPTRRIATRTVEQSLELDQSEKERNPESDGNGYFNVCGLPAITVPCGFTRDGMPIGVEIGGPHFSESTLLALAHAYERAAGWYRQRPDLRPKASPSN